MDLVEEYQKALDASGYKHKLEYKQSIEKAKAISGYRYQQNPQIELKSIEINKI